MASLKPANGIITQAFGTRSGVGANVADITDSGTGTGAAEGTIAAGVGVETWTFSHTFIAGTDAVEPVTAWTPGFKFKILSWACVTDVLLVGASGSRVANMEIGTVNVGTSMSTCTAIIANAAVGVVTAGTAVAGLNLGSASDTFSIEIASGGTAFSAGKISFLITVQNMDTADAFAVLAAQDSAVLSSLETAGLMETS